MNEIIKTENEAPAMITPMDLMAQAIEKGGADELEKLMLLQERYEANRAQKAFSAALAGFQAAVPPIHKNKQADRYTFASFDEIMRIIKPYLATAGLSIRFTTETTGESVITATCTITHRDGHSEESHFAAPIDPQMRVNQTQKMGSANSYAKRYCLVNALNLSLSDEDDDGAGAGTMLVSDEEAITLKDMIAEWDNDDITKLFAYLRISDIYELRADRYAAALNAIRRKQG